MKKFLLSIFALMLAVFSVQAQETVAFDATQQNYANAQKITNVTIANGIQATFNQGGGGTAPAYYTSGTAIRLYAKGTLTIESTVGKITKVVFGFGSSDKTNAITANCGTFSTNTWTGESDEVVFTIGGTKDHRRFKTISVTYTTVGEGGGETPEPEQPETPEPPTDPTLTASCNFDNSMNVEITNIANGATVYYTTDKSVPSANNGTVYSTPFTIKETTTVKAIAVNEGGSSEVVSATYTKNEPKTITDVIADGAVDKAMTSGTVVATYSRGFLLGDGAAYILVYQGANLTNEFSAGDVVSISGPVSKYGGLFQFGTTTDIKKTGEAELTHPEVTTMDGAAMDEYLSKPSIQYVEYTGVLTIDGTYYNVAVEGAKTAIGSIQYPKEGVIEAKDKDVVKVTGYTISISNKDNEPKYVNTMAVKVEVVEGGITEPEVPVDGSSWNLVEDVNNINVGDEIIIAYDNCGLGAKSNSSTVYHTKVDIKTTNDGKALTDIGEAKVLTVGKNGDYYTFSYDGNYLYWSSGNSLPTNVSVSDNSSWTIAIENGEATISNKKDNTRKLQYNPSNPRFACYTGTQKNVRIYKKVAYTLSVTDAGYATLFLDFNAAIPAGVEAYIIKKDSINKDFVTLTQVKGVLPANTGVIVKANEGNYTFAYSKETPTTIEDNLLEGTVVATEIEKEAYVLSIVNGEVGLYKATTANMARGFLNNANKAYLPASAVPASAALSAGFRFDFGGTTAIEEVETEAAETVIYDLTGRRVNEITKAGVYIVNGRKVLVK